MLSGNTHWEGFLKDNFVQIKNNSINKNSSEFISLRISQSSILRYNINLTQYVIISELYKIEKKKLDTISTASYFAEVYPALFSSRKVARKILEELLANNLVVKKNKKDRRGNNTFGYYLSSKGKALAANALYILDYTKEEYFNMLQVIDHWNSHDCFSVHKVKPYGETQTKNIHNSIHYIKELLEDFTFKEIENIIDDYSLKFSPEYLPENKNILTKAFSTFVKNDRGPSEFYEVHANGVKKSTTTIDELEATGITATVLKKAYTVLSDTGAAKEAEKLQIQRSIIRMHGKHQKRLTDELEELYGRKKVYREYVYPFNTFLMEMLKYLEKEVGIGKCKPGYISFRQGNKLMEGFSKAFADKYNIFLWPTEKQKEQIIKSLR